MTLATAPDRRRVELDLAGDALALGHLADDLQAAPLILDEPARYRLAGRLRLIAQRMEVLGLAVARVPDHEPPRRPPEFDS